MISVIFYGRNDAHGYNLHKRAAISLNCIAEMLSDHDDEIIFVDYNTPTDLPTFIEAIYDTLTDRARRLLRVLRLRPAVHDRLCGTRTHLVAVEPISRNIAIRRSNPNNRWILSTNTDMIFVSRDGVSDLTAVVGDLADGHYVLPRFELPEPLWESFSRQDPVAIIKACDQLGRALHLNEVAVSHPYMRFDSPGDFQLIPRQTLFDIFGFDERMIHGWHVDSNMCKRLHRLYGSTESLAGRLKGYHCDHTRVATLAHRLDLKLENDLHQFVYDVEDPYARHQTLSWGLPTEMIEESGLVDGLQARFATAVQKALGAAQESDYQSDANELKNYVVYHAEHVLPYLAGNLTVCPLSTRILYIGNNPRLLELLATCVSHLGFTQPLHYLADVVGDSARIPDSLTFALHCGSADDSVTGALIADHELLIFDFGLPMADTPRSEVRRVTDWPREARYSLGAVARWLEACAERCDDVSRSTPQQCLPDFLVVNANHYVFDQFISHFLLTTQTPYNTHVRKGRARLGQDRLNRSHRWKWIEEALRSVFGYDAPDHGVPRIAPGMSLDLTTSGCSSPYKDGHWGAIDFSGTWTDGTRAEILLSIDPAVQTDLMAEVHVREAFIGPEGEAIHVNVELEGERLAHWVFDSRYSDSTYQLLLPRRLLSTRPVVRLSFEIENPHSAELAAQATGQRTIGEDPRELGIKIQSIAVNGIERCLYTMGCPVEFTAGGRGIFYMSGYWTAPDHYGTWTLGPEPSLLMYLQEAPETPVVATFTISDVAVSGEFPTLDVEVFFNDERIDTWVLGPDRITHDRKALVPSDILKRREPLSISFRIITPRSPAQLRWSADTRPLGFRLTRFRMERVPMPKYRLGQIIDFTERGNAEVFLGRRWGLPDEFGRWTEGSDAELTLRLDEPPSGPIPASFLVSDSMVSDRVPTLPVQVFVNGTLIQDWIFGPDRKPHVRDLEIPAAVLGPSGDLVIAFRILEPRTPVSLGWSGDKRLLGIRLTRVCVGAGDLPTAFPHPSPEWRAFLRRIRARPIRLLRRLISSAVATPV